MTTKRWSGPLTTLLGAALLLTACGGEAAIPTATPVPPAPATTAALPPATLAPPTETTMPEQPTLAPMPPDNGAANPTATSEQVAAAPPTDTAVPPAPKPPTATPRPPTRTPAPARPAADTPTPSSPQVIVGTAISGGPITSPPLRDITPVVPGTVQVTADANGLATVTLPPPGSSFRVVVSLQSGQHLRFVLGQGEDWGFNGENNAILRLTNTETFGREYDAIATGTVTLEVNADPACLKSTPPCGRPSRMFVVTVNVR